VRRHSSGPVRADTYCACVGTLFHGCLCFAFVRAASAVSSSLLQSSGGQAVPLGCSTSPGLACGGGGARKSLRRPPNVKWFKVKKSMEDSSGGKLQAPSYLRNKYVWAAAVTLGVCLSCLLVCAVGCATAVSKVVWDAKKKWCWTVQMFRRSFFESHPCTARDDKLQVFGLPPP
jgi:hypothetical protein